MDEPNTFAGAEIDRAGPQRTDADWVAARLADPASRALVATADGVFLDGDRPALMPLERVADGTAPPVLLGVGEDGAALFALQGTIAGSEPTGVRDAAARLGARDAGLVAYATGMLNWHRRHGYCANCGTATEPRDAGFLRVCERCGASHHPRTDPVVIMLIVDPGADRVLLGRQPSWPRGRYSALAGFVEPGESLESAVAREVGEEAGVTVTDTRYASSQPWPFPGSLMLGFTTRYAGGEPAAVDGELDDVRWFTRDELTSDGDLVLPPRLAIARRLIDAWL